jgi:threonyl-tRNA synthetase
MLLHLGGLPGSEHGLGRVSGLERPDARIFLRDRDSVRPCNRNDEHA